MLSLYTWIRVPSRLPSKWPSSHPKRRALSAAGKFFFALVCRHLQRLWSAQTSGNKWLLDIWWHVGYLSPLSEAEGILWKREQKEQKKWKTRWWGACWLLGIWLLNSASCGSCGYLHKSWLASILLSGRGSHHPFLLEDLHRVNSQQMANTQTHSLWWCSCSSSCRQPLTHVLMDNPTKLTGSPKSLLSLKDMKVEVELVGKRMGEGRRRVGKPREWLGLKHIVHV